MATDHRNFESALRGTAANAHDPEVPIMTNSVKVAPLALTGSLRPGSARRSMPEVEYARLLWVST